MNKVLAFMIISAFMILFSIKLDADMGPKSTAEIEIVGMDEAYTLDILIPRNFSVELLDQTNFNQNVKYNHYLGMEYPDTLNGYQDSEGYASGVLYSGPPFTLTLESENPDIYEIGYFAAPRDFKVILFNDAGDIIVSESITRQFFNAEFTFDVSDVSFGEGHDEGAFNIREVDTLEETRLGSSSFLFGFLIGDMVLRTLITLAIELFVLFLFFYREKHTYLVTTFTNVITQGFLSVFVVLGYQLWGGALAALFILFLGEMIVFIAEGIAYTIFFKEKGKLRALTYAFTANFISLIAGFIFIVLSNLVS